MLINQQPSHHLQAMRYHLMPEQRASISSNRTSQRQPEVAWVVASCQTISLLSYQQLGLIVLLVFRGIKTFSNSIDYRSHKVAVLPNSIWGHKYPNPKYSIIPDEPIFSGSESLFVCNRRRESVRHPLWMWSLQPSNWPLAKYWTNGGGAYIAFKNEWLVLHLDFSLNKQS